MNREVSPQQRKFIRVALYSPILFAFFAMFAEAFVHARTPDLAYALVLSLMAFCFLAFARRIEKTRKMVWPPRADYVVFACFAIFWTLIMVGPRILRHKDDWVIDLITYVAGLSILAPMMLFFRKQKPAVVEEAA
jgi:hypothetical protein